jgi:hypothetical protein
VRHLILALVIVLSGCSQSRPTSSNTIRPVKFERTAKNVYSMTNTPSAIAKAKKVKPKILAPKQAEALPKLVITSAPATNQSALSTQLKTENPEKYNWLAWTIYLVVATSIGFFCWKRWIQFWFSKSSKTKKPVEPPQSAP